MPAMSGLDQMGNLRFKSGTRRFKRLKVDWKSSGIVSKSFDVAFEMEKFDTIQKLGAADLFVCDEFHCDWGPSDDPTDEFIVLFLIFSPSSQPAAESAQMIEAGRVEALDVQNWRFGGSLLAQEVTPADFDLDHEIELAADESLWEAAQFETRFGMDLNILGHANTLSSLVVVWNASGHRVYNLIEVAQPMSQWAGYEFEEIEDCDMEDSD